MTSTDDPHSVADDPEGRFLGLPAGLGDACEGAWRAFVSDPPASRALAEHAFGAGDARVRAYAGICLAYHQARAGEAANADATVAAVRPLPPMALLPRNVLLVMAPFTEST